MCHGSLDAKLLMREAEDRVRVTAAAADTAPSGALPPELMGGLAGVWARLVAGLSRLTQTRVKA
ncbi:hypothetical protein [Gymnodinialimonas sp.]